MGMISRRHFLRLLAVTTASGLGAAMYTWRIEPHWLEVVHRRLPLRGLPPNLIGSRLAQLSDLHIGPQVDDTFLKRTFQLVKELSPEFVVYTGDFTSHQANILAHARRMFAHLPSGRYGTFGILGNHDYGPGWSRPEVAADITAAATDAGVVMLRNQATENRGLHFVGMDDLWAGRFDPVESLRVLPAHAVALVLTHNPDTVDLPGWGAYSGWILGGHTHGGQCKPPFLPPPLLPVRNRRYTSGKFNLSGGRRLYISRGVGHLIPVRFNVRPEVTVFHLDRE